MSGALRFGVNLNNREPLIAPDYDLQMLLDLSEVVEGSGFDSVWVGPELGKKSGRGFSDSRHGDSGKGEGGGEVDAAITDRLMLRLLNEAVACWREGVVSSGDRLDAGVIFGTGFAPFRGGPLQHITASGAAALLARLQELEQTYGNRFTPDAGWKELVAAEAAEASRV